MIIMVINVTIYFLVTFVTKITNLPMATSAIILTYVSNVQWLIWLRERVGSFFFLCSYFVSCSFKCPKQHFYTHPLISYLFALRSCNCVIAFRFLIN